MGRRTKAVQAALPGRKHGPLKQCETREGVPTGTNPDPRERPKKRPQQGEAEAVLAVTDSNRRLCKHQVQAAPGRDGAVYISAKRGETNRSGAASLLGRFMTQPRYRCVSPGVDPSERRNSFRKPLGSNFDLQAALLKSPITAKRITAPMTALIISAPMPPMRTNPIRGKSQPAMKAPTMPTTILPMSPKP